jgi:hypothetical protein
MLQYLKATRLPESTKKIREVHSADLYADIVSSVFNIPIEASIKECHFLRRKVKQTVLILAYCHNIKSAMQITGLSKELVEKIRTVAGL